MPELGDAPIQPEYEDQMRQLAAAIDHYFNGPKGQPKKTGFCLMVYPFGEGGRCNYISNSNRQDVVVLLREQLKRFEGQKEETGHG